MSQVRYHRQVAVDDSGNERRPLLVVSVLDVDFVLNKHFDAVQVPLLAGNMKRRELISGSNFFLAISDIYSGP